MVEQIRISPEEIRGYGNVCEEHTLDDFTVNVSSLSKVSETVHGALTNTYKLLYSVYGLMFDFDKGAKQLYLQTNEADTLSLGFDTVNKQLYLVDENDTGFSLSFDEDTNELYITDDAPPIVHNYSLALDQSSYTTTGSLSVSATLLDDGVAVEGATVSFTGGVSTVTGVTDSSGVATATVNFTSSGTLTATYSNVSDTASVTVSQNLLLSTNKSILSYYDSETATLTAVYSGGSGATIELYNAATSVKIGNFTDAGNGNYTYSYSSAGTGDISLMAKIGTLESSSVSIEDCIFYGINTNAFTIPSNTTFTSDGSKITATTSTSGEKVVSSKHAFNQNDNFVYEVEVADIGSVQSVAVVWDNTAHWGGQSNNVNKAFANLTGSDTQVSHTFAVGDKYKVIRDNGTTSVYINDTLITSASVSYNSTFTVGFYINRGRTQYYKNIKIKSLE